MIVVDTSALAGLFHREAGYERPRLTVFAARMAEVPVCCIAEFAALRRFGEARIGWLNAFLDRDNVVVVGIGPEHRELAVEATLKYGKGGGHPAQLNFGDCLVYAVAKHADLPLLFVGDDFRHTDITPALLPQETRP